MTMTQDEFNAERLVEFEKLACELNAPSEIRELVARARTLFAQGVTLKGERSDFVEDATLAIGILRIGDSVDSLRDALNEDLDVGI